MLVLSRHEQQVIMIGDNIEITIVKIRGESVRIGISAPKGVSVHRKEVYDSIKEIGPISQEVSEAISENS